MLNHNSGDGFFVITWVTRDDLGGAGFDGAALSDDEMVEVAMQTGAVYLDSGYYWDHLAVACEKLDIPRLGASYNTVNCYFCGKEIRDRDATSADDYNGSDGGEMCQTCLAERVTE